MCMRSWRLSSWSRAEFITLATLIYAAQSVLWKTKHTLACWNGTQSFTFALTGLRAMRLRVRSLDFIRMHDWHRTMSLPRRPTEASLYWGRTGHVRGGLRCLPVPADRWHLWTSGGYLDPWKSIHREILLYLWGERVRELNPREHLESRGNSSNVVCINTTQSDWPELAHPGFNMVR